jgi:hypothetical protein
MSAMQQTPRDEALALAVKFGPILFMEHDDACECADHSCSDDGSASLLTVLHRKRCKVAKRGVCTCKPVFVHAPTTD